MKIGYHISKTNLEKSIKDANESQANAIQLFISSPKVWAVGNLKQNEIKELLEYKKTNYLVIHGKYLYNFCRTKRKSN
jgi:endonuclease IV